MAAVGAPCHWVVSHRPTVSATVPPATHRCQRGAGVSLYDVSDPYNPTLYSSLGGMGLAEPHTYAQTTSYGGRDVLFVRGGGLGGTGFGIYDFSNPAAPAPGVAAGKKGLP